MSDLVLLWRSRAGAALPPAVVYCVLAEGDPCDDAEPFDTAAVAADLRRGDASSRHEITVVVEGVGLAVAVGEAGGSTPLRSLLAEIAAKHGLVLFDPSAREVTEDDVDAAAEYSQMRDHSARKARVVQFEKAALAGDADAMNDLGNAYSFGDGVREDAGTAADWYARAAALGHAGAIQNLAELARKA